MRRLTSFLFLASLLASCGGPPKGSETPPPKLDLKVERGVYLAGNDGVEISIAELAGGEEALLRVTGIRTPIQGKVIRHKIERYRGGMAYVQTYRGRTRYTVRNETRYGRSSWRAFIPGHSRIKLAFDKEKSAKLDTAALAKEHARQLHSGELAELRRFDRQAEQRKVEEKLASRVKRMSAKCGKKLPLKIDWSSLDDEQLKRYSVSSYCSNLSWQIRQLCRYEAGRRFFSSEIKELGCAFGSAMSLVRSGGTIKLTVAPKTVNLHEKVREALKRMKTSTGRTLAQDVTLDRTDVCLDPSNKKRVVVLGPREATYSGISYGDGKSFFRHKPLRYLGGGWFSDPRQFNKRFNRSIRGYDLRFYSYVRAKRKQGSCKLVCGTREKTLKLASREKTVQIVTKATFKEPPHKRLPYALARDRRGTYYYVDRGNTDRTKRDYHLYIGRRGRMKKQAMKDIISDSQGEVFSSRKGKLRLILGKASALWIKRRAKKKLLWVPVKENLNMIYNELGVYLGARLGVPCDDY